MGEFGDAVARRPLNDPIDRQIAAALVADGRSTLKAWPRSPACRCPPSRRGCAGWRPTGSIRGYTAAGRPRGDRPAAGGAHRHHAARPAQPDDDSRSGSPGCTEIEACHSVAGDDSFVLFVRVATPTALEALIREIRRRAERLDPDHRGAADVLRAAGTAPPDR